MLVCPATPVLPEDSMVPIVICLSFTALQRVTKFLGMHGRNTHSMLLPKSRLSLVAAIGEEI